MSVQNFPYILRFLCHHILKVIKWFSLMLFCCSLAHLPPALQTCLTFLPRPIRPPLLSSEVRACTCARAGPRHVTAHPCLSASSLFLESLQLRGSCFCCSEPTVSAPITAGLLNACTRTHTFVLRPACTPSRLSGSPLRCLHMRPRRLRVAPAAPR